MSFTHTVPDRDGKQHRRRSQNHRYSYAMVAHWPARSPAWDSSQIWPQHSTCQWSHNERYAHQYAADARRNGAVATEVIEITDTMVVEK